MPANGTKTTQATPDPEGIYEVGNGVLPPKVISFVDPMYTERASIKKVTGTCLIELVVDAQGNPRDIHVVKSIGEGLKPKLKKIAEGLDENAAKAVSQYKFAPAQYQGKPVPVHQKISVDFQVY
jgi:protein TonB